MKSLTDIIQEELTHGGICDEIAQVSTSMGAIASTNKDPLLREMAQRLDAASERFRDRMEEQLDTHEEMLVQLGNEIGAELAVEKLVEELAKQPCVLPGEACEDKDGYSRALWCFPCKAREVLKALNETKEEARG